MAELVPVRVRDWSGPDPDSHPEGDIVFVLPTPSLKLGLEAQRDIRESLGDGSMLAERWLVTFVKYGAIGWNFEDEDGPIDFDVEVVLADYSIASPVAEKCDELYGEAVTRPLLNRLRNISQRGPRAGSTSRTPGSTPKPRRRSSPATTAATKRSSG
jgi:hypothetical protein